MADIDKAVQLNPQYGLAWAFHGYSRHLMAKGLFSFGKNREARLDFERAVALAPDDVQVLF